MSTLAQAIELHGGGPGRLIVVEARRARLPLPLACALVEQEPNVRDVRGRDAVRERLRVSFGALAAEIARYGVRGGLAAYRADGPVYAARVLARERRWKRILRAGPKPLPHGDPRTLRRGDDGHDVALLQRTLNRYHLRWGAPQLQVDGRFGERTELAFRRVRLVLGLPLAIDTAGRVLVSPRDRLLLRCPRRRTAAELARAAAAGRRYERHLRTHFRRPWS